MTEMVPCGLAGLLVLAGWAARRRSSFAADEAERGDLLQLVDGRLQAGTQRSSNSISQASCDTPSSCLSSSSGCDIPCLHPLLGCLSLFLPKSEVPSFGQDSLRLGHPQL